MIGMKKLYVTVTISRRTQSALAVMYRQDNGDFQWNRKATGYWHESGWRRQCLRLARSITW